MRFEAVFRTHARAVLSYARYQGASREDAEDILVDTFLAVWRHLDELPPSPLPWLLGVARHRLIDRGRSRRRYLALIARLVDSWPGERSFRQPTSADAGPGEGSAAQVLLRLPQKDREALLLVSVCGLTSAEAADLLHCTPVAVRHRVSRGRTALRAIIESSPAGRPEVTR